MGMYGARGEFSINGHRHKIGISKPVGEIFSFFEFISPF
jgi:hypothetical protein